MQEFGNCFRRQSFVPSETEEEVEELLDFVKEIGWDRLGAFTYSKEEDTPACTMDPEVDEAVALERLDRLMAVQKEITVPKSLRNVGNTIEVLAEDQDALTGTWRGRSAADAPDEVDGKVIFTAASEVEPGQYIPVRITGVQGYDLVGVYEG